MGAREGFEACQWQAENKDAEKHLFGHAEHALKKGGFALRIRRDGRRWIQTVKTEPRLHGGLSQVVELESPAPGGRLRLEAIPDASVRDAIIHHVNGFSLQPICET